MRVATQTYVAAVLWMIMLGVVVFLQSRMKKLTGVDQATNIVSLLLSALISLYAINCMVVGNCNLFTWFYVLMMALSVGLLIIALIMKNNA